MRQAVSRSCRSPVRSLDGRCASHARSRSPFGVTRNPASVSTSASSDPSDPTPSARSTASEPSQPSCTAPARAWAAARSSSRSVVKDSSDRPPRTAGQRAAGALDRRETRRRVSVLPASLRRPRDPRRAVAHQARRGSGARARVRGVPGAGCGTVARLELPSGEERAAALRVELTWLCAAPGSNSALWTCRALLAGG